MNGVDAYKLVNNRLTLYNLQYGGSIASSILSMLGVDALLLILCEYDKPDIILQITESVVCGGIVGHTLGLMTHPIKSDEILLLKKIKAELEEGINRFEDIKKEDFKIAFAKEYIKEKENGTKLV